MGSTFFYFFIFFLLLAPLFKGGNRPLPVLLLELGAVGFLFVVVALHRAPIALPRTILVAIGVLLIYPLVQLLPLPEAWWRALPGHTAYIEALDRFAGEAVGVRRALSVVPPVTEYGWLALLPPLACLLAVLRLRAAHLPQLLLVMAGFAGLEGLLGLLQVGAGGDSIFYFRTGETYGTAIGTFGNRNHLAGMLAMTLPLIVGLLAFSMRNRRHRPRSTYAGAFDANLISQRVLVFASAVMILLCLVFTRSRAGIATALLGVGCSAIVLARARTGVRHANLLVVGLIALTAVLAVLIGIAPILERFEPDQLQLNDRWQIAAATLGAAIEFLPFGSGLSTFPDVFPRFQTGTVAGFVNYAHNEYAQAFIEIGLAAPVVVGLLLAAYVFRMLELLRDTGGRSFTLLQLAAGIGLLPMIIHSLFDFGLHIPAVAMWAATLVGVMFHPAADSVRTPAESALGTAASEAAAAAPAISVRAGG